MQFYIRAKTFFFRANISKIRMERQVSTYRTYEDAVRALNNLQTNSQLLDAVLKERQKNVHLNLPETQRFLLKSGMTMEDLDSIPVIHVSGTKGKGSTCAFCESILRRYGLKTGFYSSPHLISATERIRLNGEPISKTAFAKYFWSVYDKVCADKSDRPAYFKFLTILAFNIFWKENVDVAIIEVGVGGMYDCTNILRQPVACGITKLDLDHTSLLGDTLEKIAWQKSGIMKKHVTTFIDGMQSKGALKVFQERSLEVGSPLYRVPDLSQYGWGKFPPGALGLYGAVNNQNASLALQLTQHFLRRQYPQLSKEHSELCSVSEETEIESAKPFKLRPEDALGLRLCKWPGRTQVLTRGKFIYFLDGAHTELSVQGCRSWFDFESERRSCALNRAEIFRVLLFNSTGDRKADTLLSPFVGANFDHVVFCTNIPRTAEKTDNENHTTTLHKEESRIKHHAEVWRNLQSVKLQNNNDVKSSPVPCSVNPFIDDALLQIQELGEDYSQVQILITGSLHLIGGILNLLEPNMWTRQKTSQELDEEESIVRNYFHSYSKNLPRNYYEAQAV